MESSVRIGAYAVALLLFLDAHAVVSVGPLLVHPAVSDLGDVFQQQDSGGLQQDLRIKVSVDLVPVDVTVHGSSVRELRASDFVIYDDGLGIS